MSGVGVDREFLCKSVTGAVIGAATEVHRQLGPGLLESVYETCLADELCDRVERVERQAELPIEYKGRLIDGGLRLDLIVHDLVIVELKAVEKLLPVHEAQLMTYLKLARKPVGLLINFNVTRLRDGIVRRALTQSVRSPSVSASSAPSAVITPARIPNG